MIVLPLGRTARLGTPRRAVAPSVTLLEALTSSVVVAADTGRSAGADRAAGARAQALTTVLVSLTFVTGIVDAVTYLGLGHVFAANMTGSWHLQWA